MIEIKRRRDGKIFTSDMSKGPDGVLLEIHFCTSYTQVLVQECECDKGPYPTSYVFCDAVGTKPGIVDMIAFEGNEDWGDFL